MKARDTDFWISPEDKALLLLSRRPGSQQDELDAVFQRRDINWVAIADRAQRQHVFPLVYKNLEHRRFSNVPNDVQRQLAAAYLQNSTRNALLWHELRSILLALNEVGVPVIPLKGFVLAFGLYGVDALRVSGDIDILVPRNCVSRAFDVLKRRGYKSNFRQPWLERLALQHGIECCFSREESNIGYFVDLHQGLYLDMPRERAILSDLWAAAIPKEILGISVLTLSPEWELLFLSAHAARHQWRGLKWLVDVHEVCLRGDVDWEMLGRIARQLGWESILRTSVVACKALLGTSIPQFLDSYCMPSWLQLSPFESRLDGAAAVAFDLRLLSRYSEKLRYIVRLVFVPTSVEENIVRLPPALCLFYYLLRPVRLILKWRRRLCQ